MTLKNTSALLVLMTLLGCVGGLATATEAGSYEKALAQANAENKMLVIDFYTDW